MPAAMTHYIHAEAVIKALDKRGINTDVKMVLWGAQGPDIMYFHRAMPYQLGKSLRRVGSMLHKSGPERLISTMAELCRDEYSDVVSYAYGFLCHYALDRTAHPYVYAMQEKYAEKEKIKYNHSYIHNLIEHNIDIIILKDAKSLRPADVNIDNVLSTDNNIIKRQSELLNAALSAIMPKRKIKTEKIEQAFYDMHRNTKTMIDHGVKKRFVLFLEKILHTGPVLSSLIEGEESDGMMDYMNLSKESWKNPFDKVGRSYNDNFYEVLDRAVSDAVNLILKFIEYKGGRFDGSITDNITFNRGITANQ
ncbi:MAG TPA: zinc dependent phospholipase C family protein [Firmicutes bacterium]|nr:zinc dependent phospholipase C family protein [Bacillota bacterium]